MEKRSRTLTRVDGPSHAERTEVQAALTGTIAELNEVRMRVDAVIRRVAAASSPDSQATALSADIDALRLRLLGKLDRIREKLVDRLAAERRAVRR